MVRIGEPRLKFDNEDPELSKPPTPEEEEEFLSFKCRNGMGDDLSRLVLPYVLKVECDKLEKWKDSPGIFKLPDSKDIIAIRISDRILAITLYHNVNTESIALLRDYQIGQLIAIIDSFDGNIRIKKNKIDINCYRIIKKHEPLYNIFNMCYLLDSLMF